jgi:hypothetical protein
VLHPQREYFFMKKTMLVAVLLAGTAFSHNASAATALNLSQVPAQTVGPQSTSNPCIICATQAQQPGDFGFNNFTANGGTSSYNMFSDALASRDHAGDGVQNLPNQAYTVSQIVTALGGKNAFDVAIDVNTAQGAERLLSFEVLINGVQQYFYNGGATGTLIGNASSNGNGFADWILSRIDLSKYASTDSVLFHANWNNASDGGESFFIVNPSQVPIPPAVALFGLGLAGIGLLKRASKKRNANLDIA